MRPTGRGEKDAGITQRGRHSLSNEGIVQPRESEIEHIASTAFTEFFPVRGFETEKFAADKT